MNLIRNGTLKVGEKMPPERELSEQLKVSRNTISTTYDELEQQGVLKSYQGKGTFVAEDASSWKAENIRERIMKFVDLSLEEAFEIGINADEFLNIVIQRVDEKKELMNKIIALYIECNIEQSRMFSKQLSKMINMNVIPLTINDLKIMNEDTRKLINTSQVIIATFNHINEVVQLISDETKEILGVAINANIGTIVKIARYPVETKFGFLCLSQEFIFKVSSALESAGLEDVNIVYSNSVDKTDIEELIGNSDVIIVSPGRYKEVKEINKDNKEIIEFLYSLDDSSVKALSSKIIELKYRK
jgi:DNA-binding transcriptional regulator YhcF (GntR family)